MRKIDPEKYAARRREILGAALACFARKGFHRTTTAEICAEAGISAGNLFHYFESKDAIIIAIVEEDRREVAATFEEALRAADLFGELLKLVDRSIAEFADPDYIRIGMEIVAESVRNPRVSELVARNELEKKRALAKLLASARDRGQVVPSVDPAEGADWILLLLDGAFGRAAIDPEFEVAGSAEMLRRAIAGCLRPQT